MINQKCEKKIFRLQNDTKTLKVYFKKTHQHYLHFINDMLKIHFFLLYHIHTNIQYISELLLLYLCLLFVDLLLAKYCWVCIILFRLRCCVDEKALSIYKLIILLTAFLTATHRPNNMVNIYFILVCNIYQL